MTNNNLTMEEAEHRRVAFNGWLREKGDRLGFYLLPAHQQGNVQGMLKKAYYAGSNYEAKEANK